MSKCNGELVDHLFLHCPVAALGLAIEISWCLFLSILLLKCIFESVDHLLLHCAFAKELWSLVFCLFGVQWVMPGRMIELLECWNGDFLQGGSGVLWRAALLCLMWTIWKERNKRAFEDLEWSTAELKLIFCVTCLIGWLYFHSHSHSHSSF